MCNYIRYLLLDLFLLFCKSEYAGCECTLFMLTLPCNLSLSLWCLFPLDKYCEVASQSENGVNRQLLYILKCCAWQAFLVDICSQRVLVTRWERGKKKKRLGWTCGLSDCIYRGCHALNSVGAKYILRHTSSFTLPGKKHLEGPLRWSAFVCARVRLCTLRLQHFFKHNKI